MNTNLDDYGEQDDTKPQAVKREHKRRARDAEEYRRVEYGREDG